MAYKVIKAYGSTQGHTKRIFVCDAVTDIESLPTNKAKGSPQSGDTVSDEMCAVGSIAEVTETGDKYVLSANSEWVAKPGESSGGSDISIDASLSQEGQAADAKAVGDALANKADASALSSYATTASLADYVNTAELPKGTAVADATGAEDVVTQLNALIASLETAGLIATS